MKVTLVIFGMMVISYVIYPPLAYGEILFGAVCWIVIFIFGLDNLFHGLFQRTPLNVIFMEDTKDPTAPREEHPVVVLPADQYTVDKST